MSWKGACSTYGGGERRGVYRVLVRRLAGKDPLEDLGVDRRIILKRIIKEWDGGHGLDCSVSG